MLAVFEFLSVYHYQGVYYGKLRPEMLEDVREAPSKCKSVLSWSRLNPKPLQLGWVFRMSRINLSCVPGIGRSHPLAVPEKVNLGDLGQPTPFQKDSPWGGE